MIHAEALQSIPMIDTHVHRVHPNRAPDLSQVTCYIPGPGQAVHTRNTLLFEMVCEYLRGFLGLPETASLQEIEQARNARYERDPQKYLADLTAGTNVQMYCLEVGSPLFAPSYTPEEIAYFDGSIPPEKQAKIVRIERLLDDTLPQKLSFSELRDLFDREFPKQIEQEHAIAIKTCAAYYGGLDIALNVTEQEAEDTYNKLISGKITPAEAKKFYHFFLMRGVEMAGKYDLPIQIHTGEGAGKFIDYKTMSPLALGPFLLDSRVFNRVKVVLLHAGHPYEADTSNLALQFDNVYTDFSGAVWFSTANAVTSMRMLFERAPFDKVMYGSDANAIPELYGYAPMRFRKILAQYLNELVEDGCLRESRAMDIARQILYTNALGCYTALQSRLI